MKLFYVDEKHNTINDELDIGELNDKETRLLEKVLDFINNRSSRYNQFEIGNKAEIVWEDGEAVGIEFE